MKPSSMLLAAALLALAPGCASYVEAPGLAAPSPPSDAPASDVVVDARAPTDAAVATLAPDLTRSFQLRVPVTAETLTEGRRADRLELEWTDLWRYTTFSPRSALVWNNPPARDGNSCGESCMNAVIALAARTGGTLPATLTTERGVRDRWDGSRCVRELVETVTLDLREAVLGMEPELEAYNFLSFRYDDRTFIEAATVPCAR